MGKNIRRLFLLAAAENNSGPKQRKWERKTAKLLGRRKLKYTPPILILVPPPVDVKIKERSDPRAQRPAAVSKLFLVFLIF